MKRTTMRVLSVLLSVLLVVSLAPLSVLAEETTVAKIGDTEYKTFAEAVAVVQDGETITLVSDDTVSAGFTLTNSCVIDLNDHTLNVRVGGVNFNSTTGIVIKNGTINLDGAVASGDAIFGIGLRLSGDDKKCKLSLENVNVEGKDYSSAYGVFYIYNGSMTVNGGAWALSNDLFSAGGVFKSDNASNSLEIANATMDLHNVRRVVTHTTTTVEKSSLSITGDETVSAKMEHGFNRSALTVIDSTIEMENLSGRGITAENGAVSISGDSNVTLTNCVEATIDVRGDKTVTIEPSADVKLDKAPTFTSGVVSGMVEYPGNSKTYEIGDGKDYATFADAIAQVAIDQLSFVTYKVYGHVTLPDYTDLAPGSVGAVTIEGTGMDSSSITITGTYRVRLVTGSNIPLTIKNISLIDAVASTDAWENTYFAPDADIFSFENVKFNDGVIVWGGKTASFVGCIFDNTTGNVSSHYTIFIEGESNVTVEKCVFTENCQRGIKVTKSMYPNDAAVRPELSVSDSKFEMTTGKPAIVLTYADSVTLQGNTYPETGVFELDADGAPNGTTLDADITDIACMNDLYADCGALMGGKIYTTAADAAKDAKPGDVITLFYDVEEVIALPEGVILNPNGYTTAVVEADARIGDTVYGSFAEALEAAKPGEVVVALRNIGGAGFTIDKSITIDFNGYTYTVTSPVSGGDGIVIKSGLNVTLKNGSITAASGSIYALIQNSAKLTVQDMNLRGLDTTKFVLSNNICKVQILGNTNIYAANVAFDVYAYCTVTLNTTGLISGNIQVSGKNASLTVENGNFTVAPKAEWLAEESILTEKANGTYLVKKAVGIVGANMTLGSSLNVNFYVNKADLKGIDYYAIITETAADGTVKTVKVPFAAWTTKGDLYKITFEGVAAKEMADAFTIQIFDSNTDVAVSKLHEDSVRDYAMRVLAKAETTAKEKTLIVDMLNYGAAAQKFFNYNTENLANALLSDEQKGFATAEVTAEDKRVKGEKYVGSMLKLENTVQLVLVFEGLTEDMVAMVTYEGQSEPMILDSSKFVYNNSNGQVAIVIDTLEPADASKVVTCMIVDGGEVISTVSDSIESYIARVNNGAGANELYDAILKFAASAAANQ